MYDAIYTAPRLDAKGELQSAARMTVLHNGVLIQNNVQLTGPTSWLERAAYHAHPEKQPLSLQDHGNPVRFRNIWVRELGKAGKNEFTPATALLQSYVGSYEREPNDFLKIALEDRQLVATLLNVRFPLFAESPTRFFAKAADLQIEFQSNAAGKVDRLVWSVGEGGQTAKKTNL